MSMPPPSSGAFAGDDPAYEWKAVALLSLAFGVVGIDRWIIAPLAPAIMADLQLTPQDMNNIIAALGVTWGIAAVLLGSLSDRIGRRKVLLPKLSCWIPAKAEGV